MNVLLKMLKWVERLEMEQTRDVKQMEQLYLERLGMLEQIRMEQQEQQERQEQLGHLRRAVDLGQRGRVERLYLERLEMENLKQQERMEQLKQIEQGRVERLEQIEQGWQERLRDLKWAREQMELVKLGRSPDLKTSKPSVEIRQKSHIKGWLSKILLEEWCGELEALRCGWLLERKPELWIKIMTGFYLLALLKACLQIKLENRWLFKRKQT